MTYYEFGDSRTYTAEAVSDDQLYRAMRDMDCTVGRVYSRMAVELAARRHADTQSILASTSTKERIQQLLNNYHESTVRFELSDDGRVYRAVLACIIDTKNVRGSGSSTESVDGALDQLDRMLLEMVEDGIL